MYASGLCAFRKFKVYANMDSVFIVGIKKKEETYEITEIEKAKEVLIKLSVTLYSKGACRTFIKNRRLEYLCKCEGILGCIRFLNYPYLYVLTKKEKIGCLFNEHTIYSVKNVLLVPFREDIFENFNEENDLIQLFYNNINHKYMYFSYTYNLAHSVQDNYFIQKEFLKGNTIYNRFYKNNYIWNYYHCKKFIKSNVFICLFVVNGYFVQSKFSCSGKIVNVTFVARRSNKYAGTRYRKRGVNSKGYSANEVESEIILFEKNNLNAILSYVQLRGSVPIIWNQSINYTLLKKPKIKCTKNDINFTCSKNHFQLLFRKYGYPVTVVNLLSKKKHSDEDNLSKEYKDCIDTLNRALPKEIQIVYKHLDLRKAYKIGTKYTQYNLKLLFNFSIKNIGFFYIHNSKLVLMQRGILRFNCVDCLDRTNAAQLFLNIYTFIKFMKIIKLLKKNNININDISHLSQLYEQLGDAIAKQYAGSTAHKKYTPGQHINFFIQSKELFTSIKRYYISSFNDLEKQKCINLYLGVIDSKLEHIKNSNELDTFVHNVYFKDRGCNPFWWVIPLEHFYYKVESLFELKRKSGWADANDRKCVSNKERKTTLHRQKNMHNLPKGTITRKWGSSFNFFRKKKKRNNKMNEIKNGMGADCEGRTRQQCGGYTLISNRLDEFSANEKTGVQKRKKKKSSGRSGSSSDHNRGRNDKCTYNGSGNKKNGLLSPKGWSRLCAPKKEKKDMIKDMYKNFKFYRCFSNTNIFRHLYNVNNMHDDFILTNFNISERKEFNNMNSNGEHAFFFCETIEREVEERKKKQVSCGTFSFLHMFTHFAHIYKYYNVYKRNFHFFFKNKNIFRYKIWRLIACYNYLNYLKIYFNFFFLFYYCFCVKYNVKLVYMHHLNTLAEQKGNNVRNVNNMNSKHNAYSRNSVSNTKEQEDALRCSTTHAVLNVNTFEKEVQHVIENFKKYKNVSFVLDSYLNYYNVNKVAYNYMLVSASSIVGAEGEGERKRKRKREEKRGIRRDIESRRKEKGVEKKGTKTTLRRATRIIKEWSTKKLRSRGHVLLLSNNFTEGNHSVRVLNLKNSFSFEKGTPNRERMNSFVNNIDIDTRDDEQLDVYHIRRKIKLNRIKKSVQGTFVSEYYVPSLYKTVNTIHEEECKKKEERKKVNMSYLFCPIYFNVNLIKFFFFVYYHYWVRERGATVGPNILSLLQEEVQVKHNCSCNVSSGKNISGDSGVLPELPYNAQFLLKKLLRSPSVDVFFSELYLSCIYKTHHYKELNLCFYENLKTAFYNNTKSSIKSEEKLFIEEYNTFENICKKKKEVSLIDKKIANEINQNYKSLESRYLSVKNFNKKYFTEMKHIKQRDEKIKNSFNKKNSIYNKQMSDYIIMLTYFKDYIKKSEKKKLKWKHTYINDFNVLRDRIESHMNYQRYCDPMSREIFLA
ncbi:inositol 5-phosphatase, putative [Plasmodium malariae]|uniref:Inositol 5-phosphatase, putative n=1 Tax=Plasmodium malariae TaxID=5858 RepID=A0A1A8VPG8_PLAMA|nr:inositol 5-phosphatase, putative [Plasmodium malariae]SBS81552.1 inositol 5-phosphatase, putative [Plasmodium malariae]SBT86999.1 inositol 5-phosphatase, putative [Plasmodium malariae]